MSRYRNDRDDYDRERYERDESRYGSYGGRERDVDRYQAPRGGERERYYGGEPPRDYRRGEYDPRDRYEDRPRHNETRPGSYGGPEFARGERDAINRYYDRHPPEPPPPRGATRSHIRCRDIMTRDVTVATRETSLREVAAMMRDEDTGVIPVVERANAETTTASTGAMDVPNAMASPNSVAAAAATVVPSTANAVDAESGGGNQRRGHGRLVGLITDRDIAVRAVAEGKDVRTVRAEEIMTDSVHTAQPNDRVVDVIRKMGDKQVRRIPVVDGDGNLRGIISMADVALETEEDRELGNALEEISSGASFWGKIFG